MEKAILFEPKLLAEVERESPAVYKNYCETPYSKLEFADYGTSNIHMYMPILILHMLNPTLKHDTNFVLMNTFQAGWVLGYGDLFLGDDLLSKKPLKKESALLRLMMAAVSYPYYSKDTLMKKNNFWERGSIIYNAITYHEAQCFEAWKLILQCHQAFNDRFVALEADGKNFTVTAYRCLKINQPVFKPGLPLNEKDTPFDFGSVRGSNKNCNRLEIQ